MKMFNLNKNKDEDRPNRVAFYKKKSFKYGSLATGFTAIFIVLLVVLNMTVSWLSTRYPISVDLTAKQTYKIDAQSIKFAKGLDKNISIYILATKEEFLSQSATGIIIKILEQYPQYNHNISISYVDLTKNPGYSANFPDILDTLSQGDLIVKCGDSDRYISMNDLIETQTDSTTGAQSITGYDVEQQIDTALLYVTTSNRSMITLTTGHGEVDSTALQTSLKKNNYQFESKTLSTDGIDQNANVLMIVDPKDDFTSDDINKVDTFLNNGGALGKSLVVFFDPQQSTLPNLENYVKEWGISVGKGVVYDTTNSINGNQFGALSGTTDSTILGNLPINVNAVIYASRPLTLLFGTSSTYATSAIVSSMDTSNLWNPAVLNSDTTFQASSSDKKGPFVVLAKSSNTGTYKNESVSSNVLVSGSTTTFNESDLLTATYTNADILVGSINNMVGFKSPINVVAKATDSTKLNIPAGQQKFIEILFMAIVPLAVLLLGLIVWLRRRHL
jgi:ABC-2 type transport system permease protein